MGPNSTCSISANSKYAALIKRANLIFWDKAVMAYKYVINYVDRSLRDLRNNKDQPFGGITICFYSDFR